MALGFGPQALGGVSDRGWTFVSSAFGASDACNGHDRTQNVLEAQVIAGLEAIARRLGSHASPAQRSIRISEIVEKEVPGYLAVDADRLDSTQENVSSASEHGSS